MPNYAYAEWYFQLIDGRTKKPIDDDTGRYQVFKTDDPNEETIYSGRNTTTAMDQNGVTTDGESTLFSNGIIHFFTANTVTSVDITVQTDSGHAFWMPGVTTSDHRIVVWPEKTEQLLHIPWDGNVAAETYTGFKMLSTMLVKDCWLRTVVGGTAILIDFGTSTDPNGILAAVSCSVTGWLPDLMDEDDASGEQLLGALLLSTTGAVRKVHFQANTTSGSFFVINNTASAVAAAGGYIFLQYFRVAVTAG